MAANHIPHAFPPPVQDRHSSSCPPRVSDGTHIVVCTPGVLWTVHFTLIQ